MTAHWNQTKGISTSSQINLSVTSTILKMHYGCIQTNHAGGPPGGTHVIPSGNGNTYSCRSMIRSSGTTKITITSLFLRFKQCVLAHPRLLASSSPWIRGFQAFVETISPLNSAESVQLLKQESGVSNTKLRRWLLLAHHHAMRQ